jgi:hypothetical protein
VKTFIRESYHLAIPAPTKEVRRHYNQQTTSPQWTNR